MAFSFNIFKNNIGNIISIAFITFFLILLFIYFIEGITSLKNDISKNIHHNFGSSINPQKKNSCKHEDIKIKNNKIIKKAQKIGVKKNIIIKKLNNKKEKFGKNYLKKSKVKKYNFPPKKNINNKHKISNSELLSINKSNYKNLIKQMQFKNKLNHYFQK